MRRLVSSFQFSNKALSIVYNFSAQVTKRRAIYYWQIASHNKFLEMSDKRKTLEGCASNERINEELET